MRYRYRLLTEEEYDVERTKLNDAWRYVLRRGYEVLVGRGKNVYGVWWIYLGDVQDEGNIPEPPEPIPIEEKKEEEKKEEEEVPAGWAGWIEAPPPEELAYPEEITPVEEVEEVPVTEITAPPEVVEERGVPWYYYAVPIGVIAAIGAAIYLRRRRRE